MEFHTFLKGISLKAQLEFELTYFEATLQHLHHRDSPLNKVKIDKNSTELEKAINNE